MFRLKKTSKKINTISQKEKFQKTFAKGKGIFLIDKFFDFLFFHFSLVLSNHKFLNLELLKMIFKKGESGSGKSTILNTIFKGEPLYDGSIKINGLDIDKISRVSILKNLAYLGQSNLIFREESLKNNIVMGNKFDRFNYNDILQGCNLKTIEERGLNRISDISDLLSEGEKQRVCIARTLYQNKSLVIFDEFASNIDINMAKKILSYIINKNKEGITIIVSHRGELSDMCTKTIVVDECKGAILHA